MPGNLAPFDVPASTGIPRGVVESVIVLPPDLAALERTLASDNDIAGVITGGLGRILMEPFPRNPVLYRASRT